MSALLVRITAVAIVAASAAFAHDRHGNAAMNQDVRVTIEKDHVEVTFQIETNEEGTFVEAIAIDANGDGKLSAEEQAAYFAQLDARLREGLQVSINDIDVSLTPSGAVSLAPPARKTFQFKGQVAANTAYPAKFEVHNDNFLDWPGRTALNVDGGPETLIRRPSQSATHASGVILGGHNEGVALPASFFIDWNRWSWLSAHRDPLFASLTALILLIASCTIMIRAKSRLVAKIIAIALLAASLTCAGVALAASQAPVAQPPMWEDAFRQFHAKIAAALATYHRDGNADLLAPLAAPHIIAKLTRVTRVVPSDDEKSGTFELQRIRPILTRIVASPTTILHPTLRVHHEWRAIGLVRHHGHPHERIRDFACDYTLRVTDHGFQLLDCSEWHQLPDEPIQ